MEPAILDSHDPASDALDRLLRQPAAPSLPDDGFSQRVLAVLPKPPRDTSAAWRGWSVACVALGSFLVFGLVHLPEGESPIMALIGTLTTLLDALAQPEIMLALAIYLGVLALTSPEPGEETGQAI